MGENNKKIIRLYSTIPKIHQAFSMMVSWSKFNFLEDIVILWKSIRKFHWLFYQECWWAPEKVVKYIVQETLSQIRYEMIFFLTTSHIRILLKISKGHYVFTQLRTSS